MSTSFPTVLDKFYSVGEYLDTLTGNAATNRGALSTLRSVDAEYWRHQPNQPQASTSPTSSSS